MKDSFEKVPIQRVQFDHFQCRIFGCDIQLKIEYQDLALLIVSQVASKRHLQLRQLENQNAG